MCVFFDELQKSNVQSVIFIYIYEHDLWSDIGSGKIAAIIPFSNEMLFDESVYEPLKETLQRC